MRSKVWAAANAWVTGERWGLSAVTAAALVYLWLYAIDPSAHSPGSDGFYSWLHARSIAFDGDIEFTNDYALCGDPANQGAHRGTSHPDNPFYVGPALIWAPSSSWPACCLPRLWACGSRAAVAGYSPPSCSPPPRCSPPWPFIADTASLAASSTTPPPPSPRP